MHLKGFSVDSQALSPTHSTILLAHLPLGHNKGASKGQPLYCTKEQSFLHTPSSHNVSLFGQSK